MSTYKPFIYGAGLVAGFAFYPWYTVAALALLWSLRKVRR